MTRHDRFNRTRRVLRALVSGAAIVAAPAQASFLSGEALDAAANVLSIIVIIIVPIVVIALFWMVHVLPEKIAHKRHHPQRDAIQTLCLLSLVFGGLLWPLAWIWAYTKPVLHKLAYGTDKHDDYYAHLATGDGTDAGGLRSDVTKLKADLDALVARGDAPAELVAIRDQLATLEPRLANPGKEAG
jgi:CBS domain containing-hemolysin-like protein